MSWLLSNPERPYLDHSKTDVMQTFRKYGFVPPSEIKNNALETMHQVQDQETNISIQSAQNG